MKTLRTSLWMRAPAARIYAFASATERWPELLPHYRFVRVIANGGNERTVEMAARRGALPVRWTALQRNDPAAPEISFHHLSGWTKGMDVRWRFDRDESGTMVTIEHDLPWRYFPAVAEYFIDGIARRTLACMKRLAEVRDDG